MTADDVLTPSNIMFVLGLIGIMFSVFNYFRTPQEKLETDQALSKKDLDNKATILAQKEVENKAALLAQQVTLSNAQSEKKYEDLNVRLNDAMELAHNRIQNVDGKVDEVIKQVSLMSNEITKLATIIEERMPRKQLPSGKSI